MTILYLNITKSIPTKDKVYLGGLEENGVKIIKHLDSAPGVKKFWNIYKYRRALKTDYDILWVGYSAHILVPFARLITKKKVIFNTLGSLYEGIITSRHQAPPFSWKACRIWLIDFLAFNMASLSLVETNAQIDYTSKTFLAPKKKFLRAWTGVDDKVFFYNPAILKLPRFTVIFRGGLLPDSGVEYFVEAAKLLQNQDISFRLLGRGLLVPKIQKILDSFDSHNFEWSQDFLEIAELRKKFQECHLSIGWLCNEPRAMRTIEHKTFESLAMKLPFLHGRTPGIMELLKENETGFYCDLNDAKDLAKKILELKNNPTLLNRVAENGYRLFNQKLRPKYLANVVLNHLKQQKII